MRPLVRTIRVKVRAPAPQAVALASGLAQLTGRDLRGHSGTVRYGYPGIQTQRTSYQGYVFPPQLFIGYDPRRTAAGSIRVPHTALGAGAGQAPSELNSPLLRAMAAVSAYQGGL